MSAQKKVAFIMDPLSTVKPEKDTTYFLMLGATALGYRCFYMDPYDLSSDDGRLYGDVTPLDVHEDLDRPFTVHPRERVDMSSMAAVMVRTDPPFDRAYFYTTLLLDLLPPTTRVINRPQGLRNWNEKLAALFFPDLTARTLISHRADDILGFMKKHGRITLKPIDGHGGRGIVFLQEDSENLDQLIDMVTHGGSHRVVAQVYVPEAHQGDKRILLLNGRPLGAILRLHQEGKELNNMDAGGTANPAELTTEDLAICAALKENLIAQGIYFCGIDILGDRLIEINVTSPTGLRQMSTFDGRDYHVEIMRTLVEEPLPMVIQQ